MSTKTNAQKIKAYFETNPTAHVTSASVAKALKMGATSCADALGKMAVAGELHREKKQSGDSTKEVWIYSLPALETMALPRTAKAFKPLTTKPAYRREAGPIETAPSVIGGPEKVHASAQAVALQPQPEVGKNTGSLESGVSDKSLPEAQAGESTPAAVEAPAGDAEKFCTWVAEIIAPREPVPVNLHECQLLIDKSRKAMDDYAGRKTLALINWVSIAEELKLQSPEELKAYIQCLDARIVELTQKANEAQDLAEFRERVLQGLQPGKPYSQIHEICDEAGIDAGPLADRVRGMADKLNAWTKFFESYNCTSWHEIEILLTRLKTKTAEPVAGHMDHLPETQYTYVFQDEPQPTPEAALARLMSANEIGGFENVTICAIRPVGKVEVRPVLVPMEEAA